MIDLFVLGKPKPQKRHRHVNVGSYVSVYDPSKPEKKEFLKDCLADAPEEPFDEPVGLEIQFSFTRPKSHFGTGKNANKLKKSAPVYHTAKPDLDNLVKFVMDALNGVFWKDDSVIDEISAYKRWVTGEGSTHLHIYTQSEQSS